MSSSFTVQIGMLFKPGRIGATTYLFADKSVQNARVTHCLLTFSCLPQNFPLVLLNVCKLLARAVLGREPHGGGHPPPLVFTVCG